MSYLEDACFFHTKHDEELFARWTAHLPIRKDTTPFHCGPHSLAPMLRVIRMTLPKRMVEVGFCLGHSASIWLELGVQELTSIDISDRQETKAGACAMREKYDNRFVFQSRPEFERCGHLSTDAIFIDGDHEKPGVLADIELGRRLSAKWFIFDDWYPSWGPGVQPAIEESGLVPIAIFGNMAVCVERSYFNE